MGRVENRRHICCKRGRANILHASAWQPQPSASQRERKALGNHSSVSWYEKAAGCGRKIIGGTHLLPARNLQNVNAYLERTNAFAGL